MNKKEFIIELEKIGVSIDENQLNQLDEYYHLLVEWNEKINLTRIIEEKDVYLKHFYDSITLFKAIDLNKVDTLCDIGTGAGFPGLVIKIMFPNIKITLVDSLLKRINFLNIVIDKLGLKDIVAIHSRAEDLIKSKVKFEVVTSRAVANLRVLYNYALPMVRKNGYFIPLKANCDEEISSSNDLLKKYNCKMMDIIKFNLPIENSNRTLVIVKKM